MAEKITGKPTKKVSNLTLSRKGTSLALTAKWKVSAQVTTTTSKTRATHLRIVWTVTRTNAKGKVSTVTRTVDTSTTGTTQAVFNPCKFSVTKTTGKGAKKKTVTHSYTRESYYPYTSMYLKSVSVTVYTANNLGVMATGMSKTYRFAQPGTPAISDITQTEDTGHICFSIKAFDWKDRARERRTTQYRVTRTIVKPDPNNPGQMITVETVPNNSNYTGAFTGSQLEWVPEDQEGGKHVDNPDRFAVGYDGYTHLIVTAWSEGLRGDSKKVQKGIYVSYPMKPSIRGIKVDTVKAETGPTVVQDSGIVTVSIDSHYYYNKNKPITDTNNPYHPATKLRLWKLVSTDATTAAQATAEIDKWAATDIEDDWHCTAMSVPVADLKPTRGKRTWVRVQAWNQYEMFSRISEPMEVADLYNDPLTSSGTVTIRSLISGDDGTSLVASIGWNEVGEIPMTGTELSWSTDKNAWRSTKDPEKYEFDWSDTKDPERDADFDGVAVVHIQGLEQSKVYHVRARRYHDDDEGKRTYGAYTDTFTCTPVGSPESVVLYAPPYVARGRDIPLTWTYDSEAEQTEWHLLIGRSELIDPGGGTEDPTKLVRQWVGEPVQDNGTDASGSTVVAYDRIAEIAEDDEVSFALSMATGGDLVTSDIVITSIADPPTLSMTVSETLTAQPLALEFTSNVKASLVVIVRAGSGGCGGTDGETPGRGEDQPEGDVVWQTSVLPDWTYANDVYTATLSGPTFPNELDLLDKGSYVVTAVATEDKTGLSSPEATAQFDVSYASQAPSPSEDISVEPYDVTDEYGYRERGCVITLAEPDGVGTEVYDVYRLTPDGPYLIGEGLDTQAVLTDPYAPYGGSEIGYRVVTRTVDGDMDWLDFPYSAEGRDLRIDFGDEYVELPWNLSLSDSYAKDFESRRKIDGHIDGYWNGGIERKAGFSTDLIRIREQDKAAAVRRLGRHIGPCFVRTPDGCAYMADVQVTDLSGARKDFALAVSIDAVEVDLTDQYRGTVPKEESGTDDGEEP